MARNFGSLASLSSRNSSLRSQLSPILSNSRVLGTMCKKIHLWVEFHVDLISKQTPDSNAILGGGGYCAVVAIFRREGDYIERTMHPATRTIESSNLTTHYSYVPGFKRDPCDPDLSHATILPRVYPRIAVFVVVYAFYQDLVRQNSVYQHLRMFIRHSTTSSVTASLAIPAAPI